MEPLPMSPHSMKRVIAPTVLPDFVLASQADHRFWVKIASCCFGYKYGRVYSANWTPEKKKRARKPKPRRAPKFHDLHRRHNVKRTGCAAARRMAGFRGKRYRKF